MTKYAVEFKSFEKQVVDGQDAQLKCIRYLLKKYKEDFPDDMVHTYPVPDNTEVTWIPD